MKNNISRSGFLNHLVIALFLFASPLAGAYAACCAGHGGVASCNKTTGYKMCKDGTASPTCTCAVPKATKKKATTPATTTTKSATTTKPKTTKAVPASTKSTTTTTKPKSSWFGGKSTTTTPASTKGTTTNGTSARGCCSNHGGVAQCDIASGFQMCKDGTKSPSCTCH